MRDKPVHHFFQILKFVAQFFRADSDFIILVLKESRISSFFKSHTLFLRKHFVFLPVDELCLISKLPFIVPRGWDDSHERKYHIRSQNFLKLWNHFCYEQNYLKHAIKFLRLLNQINLSTSIVTILRTSYVRGKWCLTELIRHKVLSLQKEITGTRYTGSWTNISIHCTLQPWLISSGSRDFVNLVPVLTRAESIAGGNLLCLLRGVGIVRHLYRNIWHRIIGSWDLVDSIFFTGCRVTLRVNHVR